MEEINELKTEQNTQPTAGSVNTAVSENVPSIETSAPVTPSVNSENPKKLSPIVMVSVGVIAAIILITGLVYLIKMYKAPAPKVSVNGPQKAVAAVATADVSLTSIGFVPETISVKKGTQVTFTNTDKKLHQPVSDPHPQHTGLSGFKSIEPLQINESYSYIFEKPGIYTYHDELNPLRVKGTVVVE